MASSNESLGVTPPMTMRLPTESEKNASDTLREELVRQNTFESAPETDKRRKVLKALQQICDRFVREVAKRKEPGNKALLSSARGRVFTYGSFRLGVFGPGSDIDTLVVGPKYVTRDDYFDIFPVLLQKMAPKGTITDLSVVTDAFVPIIKFEFSGISIDLIYARIATMKEIPTEVEWNLKDSNLLRGLDEAELRSLNGTRVTDEILSLVPEVATFKLALRAIKLWGQRRAVYANIVGFPGGVAWAMLVARVCQLYPKATAAVVVNKFFHLIARWPWPQPVMLKHIEDGPLQVRVWNPIKYRGDMYHLMPVITPAYPSMCATHNISQSTKAIILRELERGAEMTDKIMDGRTPWRELFTKHTFFTKDYKYYLAVIALSKTKEAHKMWSGYIESKVRMLVQKMDNNPTIKVGHPFIKGYDRVHRCTEEQIQDVLSNSLAFLAKERDLDNVAKLESPAKEDGVKTENGTGIKGENGVGAEDDVKIATDENPGQALKEVYTGTYYIGIQLEAEAKSLDLSYEVNEFKKLCKTWEKYEKELTHLVDLSVQHVRNINLPDDVFEAGEVKPTKPLKKAVNGKLIKKRVASEDVAPAPKKQHTGVAAAAG